MARKISGNKIYVASVGLRRGRIDDFAATVLREIGIEGGMRAPRALEDFEDEAFDLVVSLTPEARDRIAEFARGAPTTLVYWPTPDPTGVEGSRENVLDAYRGVRDGLGPAHSRLGRNRNCLRALYADHRIAAKIRGRSVSNLAVVAGWAKLARFFTRVIISLCRQIAKAASENICSLRLGGAPHGGS
ncbi:MAG: hypothetical protein WDN29_02170 [Methylovirgula sp.]